MDDFIQSLGDREDMLQNMEDVIGGVFIDRELEALEMVDHGLGTSRTDTLAPPPGETSHNVCVPPPGETDSVTVREVSHVHINSEALCQISTHHATVVNTGLSDDSSNDGITSDSNAAIGRLILEDSSSNETAVQDIRDSDDQMDIPAVEYHDHWTGNSIYSDWTDSDEEHQQPREATRLTQPQFSVDHIYSHQPGDFPQCSSDAYNQLVPTDQQQPSWVNTADQQQPSWVNTAYTSNTVQADGSVQRCMAAKIIARKYYKLRQKRRVSCVSCASASLTKHRFAPSTSWKRKAEAETSDMLVDHANYDVTPPPPPPRPKRQRVKSNDDLFIKHLTPCDELRFMARDLHLKWITLSRAKRQMQEIFDRADKSADFWMERNIDCSYQALVETCSSESALQIVFALMAEAGDVIASDYSQPCTSDVMEYLMTDSDDD